MKRKTYQKPLTNHIEVLSECLIAFSSQGSESTNGVDIESGIEFETKKNSDTKWDNMW
ncbi:MAG: hypothetical protein ACI4UA_04905 [Bacteroidaceae bacterium]